MDLQKHIIIISGVNKTHQVESIRLDGYKYAVKFQNSDKTYSYSAEKIIWLTNPSPIDISNCNIIINGKKIGNIKTLLLFSSGIIKYYAVIYDNNFTKHYSDSEISIRRSCLSGSTADIFGYLRQCASINTLGINEEEAASQGILSSIYSKIDFIDDKTAAAIYLNPQIGIKRHSIAPPLFPFGCNASQKQAVIAALSNQISVIQGPPGTGKTQTILNIIANLLIAKKSILIVSNNNSAIDNIFEKLAKNDLDFLVASLGKKENKEAFIKNQPLPSPSLPSWRKTSSELKKATSEAKSSLEKVEAVFAMQERLAICRQELAEVEIEMSHFERENNCRFAPSKTKASSSSILKFLVRIKDYAFKYRDNSAGPVNRFKQFIHKLYLEAFHRAYIGFKANLAGEALPNAITHLEWLFYKRRLHELNSEIAHIESNLSKLDAKALMKSLADNSMTILKAEVANRYNEPRQIIASVKDLFNNETPYYPTTPSFSALLSHPNYASTATPYLTTSLWMKLRKWQLKQDYYL